jgi:glycosyltransferase involved in cell wall biosynthesis
LRVLVALLVVLRLVGVRRRRTIRDIRKGAFGASQAPRPVGVLDDLVPASRRRTVAKITGWVVDPSVPIDRVEIAVTRRSPVSARLGLVRDDALEAMGVAHARLSGFEALVDLSGLEGPTASLVVRAYPIGREPFVVAERELELENAMVASGPHGSGHPAVLQEPPAGLGRRKARLAAGTELNLLVFAHDLKSGGAQMWLWELLERSGAGREFPCTVIALGPGRDGTRMASLGIHVHVTRPCPVWDVEAYEQAVAELEALACDGGHTAVLVNTFVSLIGADVAGRLGLPYVWALHESYEPQMIMSALYSPDSVDPLVEATALRALRQAPKAVFVAEATRRLFLDVIDPARAVVVPYGVDTRAIDATRLATSRAAARLLLGVAPDVTVLLCVGTTEQRKAQTMTAQAFARIADEFPDVLLVFVGALAGHYTEGLRQFVADCALADRCRIVPVLADPSMWYRASDVLVSASDVESLPRTLLEAMCFGLPVLATAVFGVPELITDGETGWLFEPRSLAAAEAALRRVLGTSLATRETVAAAGSALVHERYDSQGYVNALSAMLGSLDAESSGSA